MKSSPKKLEEKKQEYLQIYGLPPNRFAYTLPKIKKGEKTSLTESRLKQFSLYHWQGKNF